MLLNDTELGILRLLREGDQPSAIAEQLKVDVTTVTQALCAIGNKWRDYYRDQVKITGYTNFLRLEKLWAMIMSAIMLAPDPKYFNVALTIIEKQNKMLGIGEYGDNSWLKQGSKRSVREIEENAKRLGLRVPETFGVKTS